MPFKTKLGFGLGSFGLDIPWQMASLYLLYFLTDVVDLAPGEAAFVILIGMIWDAVSDPIMGVISLKMRLRMGGYSRWLLVGSLPYCLVFCLLFGLAKMAFLPSLFLALMAHTLFRTGHTVLNVPFSTLGARLSQSQADRTSLAAYRIVFGMGGSLIAAALTLPLVGLFGGGDPAAGFTYVAILFSLISAVSVILCYRFTHSSEISVSVERLPNNSGFSMRLLLLDPSLVKLSIASIFFCAGFAYLSASLVYYFKLVLQNPDAVGLATGLIVVLIAVFTPIWARISMTRGRWQVWLLGSLLACFGLLCFFFSLNQGVGLWMICLGIFGIGAAALPVMVWSLIPDIADHVSDKIGQDMAGPAYSLIIFSQKIGLGWGAAAVGFVLASLGYDPDLGLRDTDILKFHTASIGLVLTFFLLSLICMWRFDMTNTEEVGTL